MYIVRLNKKLFIKQLPTLSHNIDNIINSNNLKEIPHLQQLTKYDVHKNGSILIWVTRDKDDVHINFEKIMKIRKFNKALSPYYITDNEFKILLQNLEYEKEFFSFVLVINEQLYIRAKLTLDVLQLTWIQNEG